MSRQLKITLTAVVLAGAFLAIIFSNRGGEEGKIYRRLDDLIALVEKSGKESRLTALTNARKIAFYFTENCRVQILYWQDEIEGRDTLTGLFVQLRSTATTIDISLHGRSLTMGSNGQSAAMSLGARAKLIFPDAEENAAEEFYLDWIKENGDWRIDRISVPSER